MNIQDGDAFLFKPKIDKIDEENHVDVEIVDNTKEPRIIK
jgi:hypothetical protein